MKAFNTKFPTAVKTVWDRKGDIYQATFEMGKADYKACFDETGRITIYKTKTHVPALPAPVLKTIRKQYKGYKIEDVDKVDKSGNIYYQLALRSASDKLQLIVAPDGNIISDEAFW